MLPPITLIDYGIGNLHSVEKALETVGATVHRTDKPTDILNADKLVLPGVGAFGACMQALETRELITPIREAIRQGTPLLGICVGLQLLFEYSEEQGIHQGLGYMPGKIVHFPEALTTQKGLKIPHMGWNTLDIHQQHPLFEGLPTAPYFYFVHSYIAQPAQKEHVLATTHYGTHFPAVVGYKQVLGVQFHPEKSHTNGLTLLKNFIRWNP